MDDAAQPDPEWNLESAELAYRVIARYVEHTQISGIVIALMASALGEERIGGIAQSEYWQHYMASKHALTEARTDVERLTALLDRMQQQRNPPTES
jgi:hypothetical protein